MTIKKEEGRELTIKARLLYCCLVHVSRRSGCGRLTGCLDKEVRGRTYICDENFPLIAQIRRSRGTVKYGRSSINQDRLFCLFEKSYL